MQSGVELVVTFKCNWFCDYCLVDTHRQPTLKFKDVKKTAENILPGTEVTFAGGEPGMVPRRQMLELINILKDKNCELDLLTNGLFIRKRSDLLQYFNEVWYHCVEYIDDKHEIEFPDLDQNKFLYILVAMNNNLLDGSIERMMDRYPHIKFLVLPDNRCSRRISLNLFRTFIEKNKDRLHERTMQEWLTDLSRIWGDENMWNKSVVDTTRIMKT